MQYYYTPFTLTYFNHILLQLPFLYKEMCFIFSLFPYIALHRSQLAKLLPYLHAPLAIIHLFMKFIFKPSDSHTRALTHKS